MKELTHDPNIHQGNHQNHPTCVLHWELITLTTYL